MKTLVHCWKHSRGYFDFVMSTMMLSSLFPDYDVTWALPPERDISNVLCQPQCELYRNELDCQFLSLMAHGAQANNKNREEFCAKVRELQNEMIFCDFRGNNLNGVNKKYKAMLEFEPSLAEKVKKEIRERFGDVYAVVHVRVGDPAMMGMESIDLTQFIEKIDRYEQQSDIPIVLVSDDMRLKEIMRSKMLVSEAVPFHSGRVQGDAYSFMLDVCIIQNAVRVFALSNLAWGSTSFSRIPALFARVPYTCKSIS